MMSIKKKLNIKKNTTGKEKCFLENSFQFGELQM